LTPAVAPATGVGSGQVKLTWTTPPANGSAIRDYIIQWSIDGTTWSTVNDGVSTARSYVVARLTNGTQYRFRLAAVNAVGQGPWSSIVSATPDGSRRRPVDCARQWRRPPVSAAVR
jgi:hypothetical protein